MGIIDYREKTKQHASKAEKILADQCDSEVPHAALELRKAIEAIAYERMQLYRTDISREKLKQWQPQKVLKVVAAIDPGIKYTRKLSVELVEGSGDWTEIGTDHSFDIGILTKHYHALGSYLHIPTITQIEDGKDHDLSKARELCSSVLESICGVIDSDNWSFSMAVRIEFPCMRAVCNSKIRRNAISLTAQDTNGPVKFIEIECFECDASYSVTSTGKNQFNVEPNLTRMKCQHLNCDVEMQIWHADARRALREDKPLRLRCAICGGHSEVVLGVSPITQS